MFKYSIQKYHESYYVIIYSYFEVHNLCIYTVNDLLMKVINESVTIFNYF